MRTFLAILLLVVVASAEIAPLLRADSPNAIKGSYIVVLKEELDVRTRDAHVLALKDTIKSKADTQSEVGFVYKTGPLLGFSARLSQELLQSELVHPDVKYIEVDQVMMMMEEVRAPAAVISQAGAVWGLARTSEVDIDITKPYVYSSIQGEGVDVYVIDTGILTTHVDFGTRATAVFNAVTSEPSTDLNGHGTHCAGTIGGTTYGVAKLVNLFAVKVLSAGGGGTTAGVIAGVDYVTNNFNKSRNSVASMSLGGGASPTLDTAVANSIAAGVVYAIAAGNSNADACNFSPARVPTAVTVGATTTNPIPFPFNPSAPPTSDVRASYSNFGTCVDIFAPGSSITSDWIGSTNTATNTISGTSMATPHVAGVLALHLATQPPLTLPAVSAAWLTTTATKGIVGSPGTGSPNVFLFSAPA